MNDAVSASAPAASASAAAAPLDEVMLAMDVVDTLRHADRLVERELSSDERDRQLKERLREIYRSQGIDVSDLALEEGVAALREERFVYRPPDPGFARTLAMLWVTRRRWGRALLAGLAALAVGLGTYKLLWKMPEERRVASEGRELTEGLPRTLSSEAERIKTVARDTEAVATAERLVAEGSAAARAGDLAGARGKVSELKTLREKLEQSYVLRIVSRPKQASGAYRIPRANPSARNYYVIVEAVDPDGRVLTVPITSEEDGRTARVSAWGVRVDESVYARVRADKQDDGIIQNNRFGEKRKGYLKPDYVYPTNGGTILDW